MRTYLLVVSHKVALRWIVAESSTAFPARKRREVDMLAEGDRLILTTTRRCFGNPRVDETRLVGVAFVSTPVVPLDVPLDLLGRAWGRRCSIRLASLFNYRGGIALAPLIPELQTFTDKLYWSLKMRSPLVELVPKDGDLLSGAVTSSAPPMMEAVVGYLPNQELTPS